MVHGQKFIQRVDLAGPQRLEKLVKFFKKGMLKL